MNLANVSRSVLDMRTKHHVVVGKGVGMLEENDTHGCAQSIYFHGEGTSEILSGKY